MYPLIVLSCSPTMVIDVVQEDEYRITINAVDRETLERVYDHYITKGITVTWNGEDRDDLC